MGCGGGEWEVVFGLEGVTAFMNGLNEWEVFGKVACLSSVINVVCFLSKQVSL